MYDVQLCTYVVHARYIPVTSDLRMRNRHVEVAYAVSYHPGPKKLSAFKARASVNNYENIYFPTTSMPPGVREHFQDNGIM